MYEIIPFTIPLPLSGIRHIAVRPYYNTVMVHMYLYLLNIMSVIGIGAGRGEGG